MQYLRIHGNQNLIVSNKGTLNTDRYGLDTAIAEWKCPMDSFNLVPDLGSPHPVWSWLFMEKRRIDITPGFLVTTGEYVGITGGRTPSLYECSYSMSDEPIQTHRKFITQIAGKPSAPLNGAIFVDIETNKKTTDDSRGVFLEFQSVVNGVINRFSGMTGFLSPETTLRETWIATSPVIASGLGLISSPPFFVQITSGANWLFGGVSFQQRGRVFANSREWRASGPRGWDDIVYSA